MSVTFRDRKSFNKSLNNAQIIMETFSFHYFCNIPMILFRKLMVENDILCYLSLQTKEGLNGFAPECVSVMALYLTSI